MSKENHLAEVQLLSAPLLAVEQLGKQLGPTLILAPHPDDEALGCGGLILYLREQNIPTWICFMTSGDASHPHSVSHPPNILSALREQEALESCKILGVEPENVIFLQLPDSLLSQMEEPKKESIISQLTETLKEFKTTSLFLPWRRDPHQDHMATYNLGRLAAEGADGEIQLVEYPIWLWKNSEAEDWPREKEVEIYRLNIKGKVPTKQRAIEAHRSQTSDLILDDPEGFQLNEDLLSPFLTPYEYFFFEFHKEKDSLTKKYFETLYANNPDPWNFMESSYEKSKYIKIEAFLKDRKYKNGLDLGCSIGMHTRFLASHCSHLLAVDISEAAIASAKTLNEELDNVDFEVMDIGQEFPTGPFQFIALCEIGYYFSRDTLLSIFGNTAANLSNKGNFLLVHWTSFVKEYPLSGRQVHELFEEFNQNNPQFILASSYTHESYELMLWEKIITVAQLLGNELYRNATGRKPQQHLCLDKRHSRFQKYLNKFQFSQVGTRNAHFLLPFD